MTSDKWGNVVSYTFTIESTGGSGLVVPGWGFLLNNELTDFNYDSTTHPNRVEGGKRPRSSMAPTIVLQSGKPFLALGSPGGSTIITTVLQILFDRLDQGMTLPQAIADPRASQRNTTTTSAEPAFLSSPLADAAAGARPRVLERRRDRRRNRESSSSPAGACSPRPSPSVAAAGARSSRTPRRSRPRRTGSRLDSRCERQRRGNSLQDRRRTERGRSAGRTGGAQWYVATARHVLLCVVLSVPRRCLAGGRSADIGSWLSSVVSGGCSAASWKSDSGGHMTSKLKITGNGLHCPQS